MTSRLAMLVLVAGCTTSPLSGIEPELAERLRALAPQALPAAPYDPTNAYADDPRAAALGHRLFFDPRFSGPLLDDDNDGTPGTLGVLGEPGRVSCESCHGARSHFNDTRSTRGQLSLASGWTRRRTPSLLDVGQATILNWDGRRDTLHNQIFGVIESPLELNSARLFVAQQVARYYRDDYEHVFGPLPELDGYAMVDPRDAGCASLPDDPVHARCEHEGDEDPKVIRVVVNMGKAIGAYERQLTCGPSRFDDWVHGDRDALSSDERAGALVFLRAGCDSCHSGPFFTDQQFHNVGVSNLVPNFIEPFDDPGAVVGLALAHDDPLNSRGVYSDGDDGRLDRAPDPSALRGAFRTPSLRCVSSRRSFFHAGQLRSLEDVVAFFDRGGDRGGFQGERDPRVQPLDLTPEERAQLVAFLRALDGPGPAPELTATPILPE